ncbi:YigZ family protein [Lachnospira multipara]|uniref:YigZ family protein n=1 Tax=Lachnospira multipara TaxID=28051 RepID=UPI00047FC182|nr:YigZ family protein [Lachnospira multipara]
MNVVVDNGRGEIVEKKSRFIAHVFSIKTEDEATTIINQIKKKYWDARHNCFAYVIGDKGEIQRFSDDGEPQGTAGKPILEVITSRDLTNVLVVVTRYFGGVLLGTGGLVRAYQGATIEGLANATLGEIIDGLTANIEFEYTNLGKIQYICEADNIQIDETNYTEKVHMALTIEKEKIDGFVHKLQNEFSGEIQLEDIKEKKICKKIK